MGRAKSEESRDAGEGSAPALDLSAVIHTRVSTEAKKLVHDKARNAGLSPATWVRVTIYRALGLLEKDHEE